MTTYQIAELVDKRKAGRNGYIKLGDIRYRLSSEMRYKALINSVLREVAREVRENILPAFQQWKQFSDAAIAIRDNENWFTSLKLLGGFLEATIRPEIVDIFDHAAHVHTDDFATEIRRRTSVDVGAIVRDEDLDEILRDRVSQNVALIKSMHQTLLGDVERMVYEAKMQGKSHKDLKSELIDRFGIANRKAALIARDQMASLNSDFNQIRQEQAGIEKYEWHTSEDERVRHGKRPHNHRVLNGKVYEWGEKTGAEQGLPPGKPINCRCVATAIIELEEFKPKPKPPPPPPKPEPEPEKPKPKPKPKKLDLTKYQPNARYQPTAKKGRLGNPSLRGHQVREKLLDSSKPAIVKKLELEHTRLTAEIEQIRQKCKSGTLSKTEVNTQIAIMQAKTKESLLVLRGIQQEKVAADLKLLQLEKRGSILHRPVREGKEAEEWGQRFEKIKDDYHEARERLAAHLVPEMLADWSIRPDYFADRAYALPWNNEIYIKPLSDYDEPYKFSKRYVIEHEITHVIEYNKKKSNAAAIAFREKRRGNEPYQKLSKLENNANYDDTEISFEDEWQQKGTNIYAGKKYEGDNSSEVLTIGVERYFRDPRQFALQDPEYFDLIVDFMRGHLEK